MAGNSASHSSRTSIHQQSFVFGSSTPRELTHINRVSKRERMIDTNIKPDTDSKDVQRKGIVFYMRQARSIESRGDQKKERARNYAFGSSTPRSLSHLGSLSKEQRVYDAKPDKKRNDVMRSETNPQLGNLRQKRRTNRSTSGDDRADDAASEPDIVQDRQMEFGINTAGGRMVATAANKMEEQRKHSKTRQPPQRKLTAASMGRDRDRQERKELEAGKG